MLRRMVADLAFARHARVVARVADALDERLELQRAGLEAHRRPFGGEVDARLDPLELVEVLLDARRAGGAGHAFDVELDDVHRGAVLRRAAMRLPSAARCASSSASRAKGSTAVASRSMWRR